MALPNPHLLENDCQRFSDLVYTPLDEAVTLLRERQSADMFSEIERDGLVEIPEVLQRNGVAVLFRQIGTPNHEMKRFLQLTSEYNLTPVVWEYLADKFVPGNAMKYAWGRLGFYKGLGRNGGLKIDYLNVIDFNSADGVALRDVQTLWGQPLVEFHHELLFSEYPELSEGAVYEGSRWLAEHGSTARNYYKAFALLFLRHAIWFEWFVLEGKEMEFTKNTFLPAFFDVYSTFGVKPLVVALDDAPDCVCEKTYWKIYPSHVRRYLPEHPRLRLLAQSHQTTVTLHDHASYTSDRDALADLVYTPLDRAVELLRLRQSEDVFSELERDGLLNIPDALRRQGVAVLCRQIGSPSHEMQRFLELTAQYDLLPVIWEYHADKFMPRNPMKYAWGRMGFHSGRGRNGGVKLDYVNVIDFNCANGRALRDVQTLWGQSLIEFHHDLLRAEYPELSEDTLYDGSRWFAEQGGAARHYYKAFIALFLRHAILFETFLLHGDELKFLREIFLPAFYDIYSTFGLRPLITPIEPEESEGDSYWQLYPGHIKQYFAELPGTRLRA